MIRSATRLIMNGLLLGGMIVSVPSCDRPEHPAPAAPGTAPASAALPAVDEYHGVKVADPYRWLEDGADPRTKSWSAEQATKARAYLDAIPLIGAVRERMTRLLAENSVSYRNLRWVGGRLFAMKNQPPLQQAMLVVLSSADDPSSEIVLVDPNRIDSTGGTTIDFYEPSQDGKRVAVSLSSGGSEAGDVHVYEVPSGHKLTDVVVRVNGGTAGGSLAWNGDGSGFWYTRYPREGERPEADLFFYQQVWYHAIGGKDADDRYEIGRDFPRIAEIQLHASADGRFVLANVQKGDGGEFTHHLRRPDGTWVQLTRYEDRIIHAVLGPDAAVYMVSRLGSPRGKVLKLAVGGGSASLDAAATIVPEETDSIDTSFAAQDGVWTGGKRLFVKYQQGGPTTVKVFGLDGSPAGTLPSPPITSVAAVVPLDGNDVLFRRESYVAPPVWLAWSARDGSARPTGLVETSAADFSDCEVVREFATSKDGTKVPVNIIRKKGTVNDGSNPTLLYGYGGYGLSRAPRFRPALRAWIDHGGVYAEANIRGGGEYGEEWHHAGHLTRKQNVFDDFAAAARYLVESGITRPELLALNGGSNGGLLMGAMITQHPEIARAVVSSVGIYDMLRVELTPNGAFNVPEFGTVRDPEQFEALYAYSPYHRVVDGTAYPSILMMTGENDPRVDPWHSRKMVARLQEATSADQPVLLRTNASAGHGIGTKLSEQVEEYTDMYAFLLHELGTDRESEGAAAK